MIDLTPGDYWREDKYISELLIILEDDALSECVYKLRNIIAEVYFLNQYYLTARKEINRISTAHRKTESKALVAYLTSQIAILDIAQRKLDFTPDMIYFCKKGKLRRMDQCTERTLRMGNSYYRLYLAGEFDKMVRLTYESDKK